ncbi:hypothetical protein T440DRAFT_305166 [Plenodomus tracheiphilus IPT5]|uniref:Uncharacterized protein n=1 Tax=Plenodomus tracheiphilus IPT5 TaxID=1408161 RepID=A0A6A7BDH9_9PLEO|nr:hypothetical protein T440DRAFT_305166 [Plenodomus tracheiphilus IPT5]
MQGHLVPMVLHLNSSLYILNTMHTARPQHRTASTQSNLMQSLRYAHARQKGDRSRGSGNAISADRAKARLCVDAPRCSTKHPWACITSGVCVRMESIGVRKEMQGQGSLCMDLNWAVCFIKYIHETIFRYGYFEAAYACLRVTPRALSCVRWLGDCAFAQQKPSVV